MNLLKCKLLGYFLRYEVCISVVLVRKTGYIFLNAKLLVYRNICAKFSMVLRRCGNESNKSRDAETYLH